MAEKKKIKTYGVRGLMEWICNIPVGKGHMRVEFTGGVLTSYGNTPAKFSTDDKFKQTVIENSHLFKSGRIVLIGAPVETDQDEDMLPMKPKPKETASSVISETEEVLASQSAVEEQQAEPVADEQQANRGADKEEPSDDGNIIVNVDSLDEAKNYLHDHFNIPMRDLRYKKNILAAAEANGISLKWTDGNEEQETAHEV